MKSYLQPEVMRKLEEKLAILHGRRVSRLRAPMSHPSPSEFAESLVILIREMVLGHLDGLGGQLGHSKRPQYASQLNDRPSHLL